MTSIRFVCPTKFLSNPFTSGFEDTFSINIAYKNVSIGGQKQTEFGKLKSMKSDTSIQVAFYM